MSSTYEVIRDTREKGGWTFPAKDPCKGTVVETMQTADYTLRGFEDRFVIERKATTSEIATNLTQERFDRELVRLERFEFPFLICEFDLSDVIQFPVGSGIPEKLWPKIRVTPQFILKKLIEIQLKGRIHLIFAGKHGREFASSLFKRIVSCGVSAC